MSEVSAQQVKELREKTGAGIMDCKKALARERAATSRRRVRLPARARARRGGQEGRPRRGRGRRRLVHPRRRQDRRADRGQLRDRLRRPHRRLPGVGAQTWRCRSRPRDPRYVRREEVPADELEREREHLRAQAAQSGKPAAGHRRRSSRARSRSSTPRSACSSRPSSRSPARRSRQVVADAIAKLGENIVRPPLRALPARRRH